MTGIDFSAERFRETQEQYEQGWRQVDDCLYDFVSQHPGHVEFGDVYAKVYMINRLYRANMHLHIAESELAERLHQHLKESNWLDESVAELNEYPGLDDEALDKVVTYHKRLLELGREWARADLDSFFSKYLHFHCRKVVPIYDNRAWDALGMHTVSSALPGRAPYYENFCRRFLRLYKQGQDLVQGHGLELNVRSLDYYLYSFGENQRASAV
jgi:hypothetical protein